MRRNEKQQLKNNNNNNNNNNNKIKKKKPKIPIWILNKQNKTQMSAEIPFRKEFVTKII